MSDKKTSSIEIDFTGEELLGIAKAMINSGELFSEFIDRAIKEAVGNADTVIKERTNQYGAPNEGR